MRSPQVFGGQVLKTPDDLSPVIQMPIVEMLKKIKAQNYSSSRRQPRDATGGIGDRWHMVLKKILKRQPPEQRIRRKAQKRGIQRSHQEGCEKMT